MIKAVGYTRVSTAHQASPEKTSLERQAHKIQLYADMMEWKLKKIYEEPGKSGATNERPFLQELMKDAHKKLFQAVIVWDISRFGRNLFNLKQNTEELKKLGIHFVAIDNGVDTSRQDNTGELLLNILASIYEFEREVIKQRTSAGRLAKQKNGTGYFGTVPYGYSKIINKETGKVEIIINEEEADNYRYFVWLYIGPEKLSMQKICTRLDREGRKPRKAKSWQPGTLTGFLKNPVYWMGKITSNLHKNSKDWVEYTCPPLITKEDWDKIQKRINNAPHRTGKPGALERAFLLHNHILCGNCGGKARVVGRNDYHKSAKTKRFYTCFWHEATKSQLATNHREKCDFPHIPADDLENRVYRDLLGLLFQKPELRIKPALGSIDNHDRLEQVKARVTRLQKEKTGTIDALQRLDDMLKSKAFDMDKYLSKSKKFEAELVAVEADLRDAQEKLATLERIANQKDLLLKFQRDKAGTLLEVYRILQNLPFEKKKKLIDGMIAEPIVLSVVPFPVYPDFIEDDADLKRCTPQKLPWWEYLDVDWNVDLGVLQEILNDT